MSRSGRNTERAVCRFILTCIFHTPIESTTARRVRARGLQSRNRCPCRPRALTRRSGWEISGVGPVAMLVPAAAFDDPQSQKQKEPAQGDKKNEWPGVHDAARKIVHLLEQSEAGQRLRLPGGL